MGLHLGARGIRSKENSKGLLGLRKGIDRRIINMILSQLTEHQRELLAATAGNPNIEIHLTRLIESLVTAERVLARANYPTNPIELCLNSDFEIDTVSFEGGREGPENV